MCCCLHPTVFYAWGISRDAKVNRLSFLVSSVYNLEKTHSKLKCYENNIKNLIPVRNNWSYGL